MKPLAAIYLLVFYVNDNTSCRPGVQMFITKIFAQTRWLRHNKYVYLFLNRPCLSSLFCDLYQKIGEKFISIDNNDLITDLEIICRQNS